MFRTLFRWIIRRVIEIFIEVMIGPYIIIVSKKVFI
jgi:hypothetical protein